MGSSKKHKDKDREHKKKRKHRSRSKSKERKHKDKKDDGSKKKKRSHHGYEEEPREVEREMYPPGLDMDYYPDAGRGPPQQYPPEPEASEGYQDAYPPNYGYPGGDPYGEPVKEEPGHSQMYTGWGGDRNESIPGLGDPIPAQPSSKESSSLSIEETNRLRAKLGLKPLDTGGVKKEDGKPAKTEDVHVPAINLGQQRKSENIKEKLQAIKEKRMINKKLGKVKTLGESDSEEEDVLTWVKKSRKVSKEKAMAEKRAKMLEEMDEEFGIGNLVEEEFASTKKDTGYGSKDLKGLKVKHEQDRFKEGKTVILTLEDRGVLDENQEDILMNVNMIDDAKHEENVEKRKMKPDYNPYEDHDVNDIGEIKMKSILSKYDEEIDGKKKSYLHLDSGGGYNADYERMKKDYKSALLDKGETLALPPPMIAKEYLTHDEIASFKKVKKKVRKIRKKPKVTADMLLAMQDGGAGDHGSRRRRYDDDMMGAEPETIPGLDLAIDEDGMDVDKPEMLTDAAILGPDEDLTGVAVDDEAALDLEKALRKARKLKRKRTTDATAPEKVVSSHIAEVGVNDASEVAVPGGSTNIILNSTSEFCRSLGDIPTYGQAGNRAEEEEDELMDFERELQEERRRRLEEEEANPGTGWQKVEIDTNPVDIQDDEHLPLEEEPTVDSGLMSALQLATKKGFLEAEENKKLPSLSRHKEEIQAQNYSIEDKRYDDLDEKYNRKRDRFGGGATMEFRELDTYKPDVKLEYVDESGRAMNAKEAFRQLSHRFHGKGSGKKKTEKRSKKHEQDMLLKNASSTDTPLGTVELLRQKHRTEKTPYIVLSGSNKTQAGPIAKS